MAITSFTSDPSLTLQKTPEESAPYILPKEDREWLDEVYEKILVKMRVEVDRVGSKIPYMPHDGHYGDCDTQGGLTFWTNGFWPGILWQMYNATGDEVYRVNAEKVEQRLKALLANFQGIDHDLGFRFLPVSVANYRKTGNEESKHTALHAANLLAARFNSVGNFIRAWPDADVFGAKTSGWMIIDCMMNIPLLFWASEESGDPRFAQIAVAHAKTAQKYVVRPDGSCNHILAFNPDTGEYENNPGGQGYGQGSSWSRGQSWAVYGFALSYRHTKDEAFLNTAKQCAHYCIANMATTGWLPLVDYRAPIEPIKYDTTAGMITAAGLLEIADHVGEYEKPLYVQAALNIMKACEKKFANWNPSEDAIMGGGTFFYHDSDGSDTHVPIIYGDYYFIEAVLKLKDKALFIW